jgi:hypothetical protein
MMAMSSVAIGYQSLRLRKRLMSSISGQDREN